jgi:hypothetical protein
MGENLPPLRPRLAHFFEPRAPCAPAPLPTLIIMVVLALHRVESLCPLPSATHLIISPPCSCFSRAVTMRQCRHSAEAPRHSVHSSSLNEDVQQWPGPPLSLDRARCISALDFTVSIKPPKLGHSRRHRGASVLDPGWPFLPPTGGW